MSQEDVNNQVVISYKNLSAFRSPTELAFLNGLNFNFVRGKKYCIIGKQDSGNSYLILTLINELPFAKGTVSSNCKLGGSSSFSYVFRISVKDNILVGQPYEENKYKQIVKLCQLEKDIEFWNKGDKTVVNVDEILRYT